MADKTLKSLNFGGADNYFPLPLVTDADNYKILSIVNGEWAAINVPEISGNYVWGKQFASSTVTEDTTSGTYTLTTVDDTRPSSEIEVSTSAPTYNLKTKKWEMAPSTTVTLTNADNTVPSFNKNMYVRLTSAPNVWYLATAINVTGSGPYAKSLVFNAKYTAAVDNSYVEYVTGDTGADYPNGGWSDGAFYTLKLVPIPCLTFDGNEDFTLKTANTTKNWDGTLEYSTDTKTWNTWNGTEISSVGGKLYLRGTGNTKITGNSANYKFVFTGTGNLKIACKGNIENLLDYETVSAGGHPTMADSCYAYVFQGCTSLTSAPELPATTLAQSCYGYMFRGCTSLTSAPQLPATKLVIECYRYMFYGCTSLTTAPTLPATKLTPNCYEYMFYGCTSLTTAPELSATRLAEYCCRYMFRGCTSLTTAPELPATSMDTYCYQGMFYGCTALTTPPSVLPATTLYANCYEYMFHSCTSLTTAPELPATTLANRCYHNMFYGCKSLTTPPSVLPATTLATSCYLFMFEFTAISAIPRIMATTYATDSCKGMFDDIKTLNIYSASGTDHAYGWTAPSSASTYCSGMFGSDDGKSEWAKLDGSNFPNSGTPTAGKTYYFKTVS